MLADLTLRIHFHFDRWRFEAWHDDGCCPEATDHRTYDGAVAQLAEYLVRVMRVHRIRQSD